MPKKITINETIENSGEITHNLIEITVDPNFLNNFANEDGINNYFNSAIDTEEFQKLKTRLIEEVLKIINSHLTKIQKNVLCLTYFEGKTQQEISSIIRRHQTSVHKTLQGNIDYINNKRYGGAIKKIQKICKKNKIIQEILKEMKERVERSKNKT